MDKEKVRKLLSARDKNIFLEWVRSSRNSVRVLNSLAYDADELIRWRAIEAVGWNAALHAKSDIEKVRDQIRRLLWLMNDESGGLGWYSPELIGEILVNVPELIPEYAEIIPSFFYEEPFERGTYHSVCRISAIKPKLFRGCVSDLETALGNGHPDIRYSAVLALENIRSEGCCELIRPLANDPAMVARYDFQTGHMCDLIIGRIVSEILARHKVKNKPIQPIKGTQSCWNKGNQVNKLEENQQND